MGQLADTMRQCAMILGVSTLISVAGAATSRDRNRTTWVLLTVAIGVAFLLQLMLAVNAERLAIGG